MPPQIPSNLAKILPRRVRKPFGILEVYPERVSFNSQDPGESIYILMRSHLAVNIGWITSFVIGLIFPVLVFLTLQIFSSLLSSHGIDPIGVIELMPLSNWIMLLLLYYSLVLSYALVNFLDWYFDIYLVTNLRILHVDFKVFTGKSVAEAALVNIEDVSTSIIGFLPSFFDYGDVLVQTAAEKNKFNLLALSNPSWFRDVITDLSNLAKSRRRSPHRGHVSLETILPDDESEGGEP